MVRVKDENRRSKGRLGAVLALCVATAALCPAGASAASNTKFTAAAPGIVGASDPDAIPGSYIVVFKDAAARSKGVDSLTQSLAAESGAKVKHTYDAALNGFAATMSKAEAQKMAADPAVAYVAQNQTVHALSDQAGPPSWGLDRVDQRNLPLNNNYHYDTDASNVTAYVIDTGVRVTHQTFGGRATWGTNTSGDGNNSDCNGHGTHVAGTIGGSQYGVAKGVRLVAVKVLNCNGSGTSAGVAAGIDWVTAQHGAGAPAVANMSLGGGADSVIDNAVRNSIADGVTYAIASGNSNTNACNSSPARVPEAITVNASDINDSRASFSNFGTCTDIFAPGVNITSAWNTSDTATNTISGTSMATPHVAGAAALYLSANPSSTPAAVQQALKDSSTPSKITNPGTGSPNQLLSTATSTAPPSPTVCNAVTNGTDVAIPDLTTVTSPITISGCSRNASATASVTVNIVHTWIGDLVVDLVAPDGSVYNLHNRAGGSADNINTTYTVNLSSEPANGTWTLRVRDAASFDTGKIDFWTLSL